MVRIKQKNDLIALLRSLVSRDTRYEKKSEKNIRSILLKELRNRGFLCEIVMTDGRPNILADNNKQGKSILCYGHTDTVGVVNGWSKKPFQLTIQGNRAFGLGAYDMKGGIAALLRALTNTHRHIKILFAVDEENISQGAWGVIEKRGKNFDDVELVLSAEPNFG